MNWNRAEIEETTCLMCCLWVDRFLNTDNAFRRIKNQCERMNFIPHHEMNRQASALFLNFNYLIEKLRSRITDILMLEYSDLLIALALAANGQIMMTSHSSMTRAHPPDAVEESFCFLKVFFLDTHFGWSHEMEPFGLMRAAGGLILGAIGTNFIVGTLVCKVMQFRLRSVDYLPCFGLRDD